MEMITKLILSIIFVTAIITVIMSAIWYILSSKLLNIEFHKKGCILFCTICSIIQVGMNFITTFNWFTINYIIEFLLVDFVFTIYSILLIFIYCKLYKRKFLKTSSAVWLSYFLIINFYYVIEWTFYYVFPNYISFGFLILNIVNIGFYVILTLYSFVLYFFMKKVKFIQFFNLLFTGPVKSILISLTYV